MGFPISAGWFLAWSLGYACFAWLWSAAAVACLYLLIPQLDEEHLAGDASRTATAAVWFAPAMILLAYGSPAALLAAAILVVDSTRLLYSQWTETSAANDGGLRERLAGTATLFASGRARSTPQSHQIGQTVATAFSAEAGAAAALLGYPLASAGFLVMCASNATVLALSTGLWRPAAPQRPTRRTATGIAGTILLAAFLTAGGMAVRALRTTAGAGTDAAGGPQGRGGSLGPLASIRTVMRKALPEPAGQGGESARKKSPQPEPGALGGDFPGVILWPEVSEVPMLVEPLPAGGLFAGSREPFRIPFGGEYWMFRGPDERPPASSHFDRASPAAVAFKTVDHSPLKMEARQKLDRSIDVDCCAEIRVVVWNADPQPGTVALELFLIDGRHPATWPLSLGAALVTSAPLRQESANQETLGFAVPSPAPLRQFDQLRVAYRFAAQRQDKSARIAIARFLLIPR